MSEELEFCVVIRPKHIKGRIIPEYVAFSEAYVAYRIPRESVIVSKITYKEADALAKLYNASREES